MATKKVKSKKKFISKIVKLGEVGVDSGQLVICDPWYIESEFQNPDSKGMSDHAHDIYKHKKTGKLYQFCMGIKGKKLKSGNPDVAPFPGTYADIMPEFGKTPNDLIASGDFVKTDIDPTPHIPEGEFSYRGICKTTLNSEDQGGQLDFTLGHPGVAVALRSGLGDGSYEVFAEIVDAGQWGKRIKKVWVELITDEQLEDMRNQK